MTLRTPLCILLLSTAFAWAADPVVSVTGGQIKGRIASDGGAAFKGVPFARPPMGDLRWREPQPVEPWTGVRDASRFRPACTQLSEGWNKADVPGDEDCLYLNVATPEWPPQKTWPVMVWVHGGSNMAGDGEAPAFEERALVRHGMVWVTVNYRLGALGFLAHPELARESAHHASGNYGLMDEVAALRWVHDNIAAFGGDPANVTIGGESAGALDVGLLMTSPLAKGLFHRVIEESGAAPGFGGSLSRAAAEEHGRKVAALLKAPETDPIRYLRTLPAQQVMEAGAKVDAGDFTGLQTSVDGWVLPIPAAVAFSEGRLNAASLIIGTNAQEFGGPAKPDELRAQIRKTYGALASEALKLYSPDDDRAGAADPLYGPAGTQWASDIIFRCPSIAEALWNTKAGNATWQYEFEHPAPGKAASVHAGELVFVFGTWAPDAKPTDADRKVAEQVQTYWANFVRTGDPNGEGLPKWPRFDADARSYLAFTDNGGVAKADLRRPFCDVFLRLDAANGAK